MDDEQKVGEPSENALDDMWEQLWANLRTLSRLEEMIEPQPIEGLISLEPLPYWNSRVLGPFPVDQRIEEAARRRAKRRLPDSYPFPDHR